MEFRRLKKRRKPNYGKALLLIIVLLLFIYLWLHAEGMLEQYFGK